jgi:hypothetical protein
VCWPALYERAPEAFAAIKRTGGWAGFYEVKHSNCYCYCHYYRYSCCYS